MRSTVRLLTVSVLVLGLGGCGERPPPDPKKVEFEKKFEQEAVLVKTCPSDPRWATGPTSAAQRVYRYEKELWYTDVYGHRKIEATPDTVCDVLTIPKPK
jgi:hypothetical protein